MNETNFIAPAPVQGHTPAFGPDSLVRQVLPNGIVVIVYPTTTIPALNLRLTTRAGALYDPPGKWGLASFTASAMRRGTASHTFSELNEITDDRALSVGLDAGYHLLDISGRCLSEDAPFMFDLVAQLLREPSFPEDEIERLRRLWITGLVQGEDDTQSKAEELFRAAAYPADHPYHHDPGGTLESIPTLTREDMIDHYRRLVRPEEAVAVIVGDITPAEGVRLVEDALGDWQVAGDPPAFAIPDAPAPAEVVQMHHTIAGKTQSDLVLGFPALRRTDPDYYALEMANLILGRLGLYGRLGKAVREDQGLAYYAYSGLEAGFGPGPWAVRAGVSPANVGRAVQSILAELARIRDEPVSEVELDAAKRFVTGTLPLRLETNGGIARQIAEIEFYGLGWDYVQRYPAIINNLTAADLQRAAQAHLHHDRYVLATAGPQLPD